MNRWHALQQLKLPRPILFDIRCASRSVRIGVDHEVSAKGRVLGLVEGIFTTDIAGAEMLPKEHVRAIAGVGLEGDRYSTGQGHYSSNWHADRQVTFIAAEALEVISAENPWSLSAQECRRNIITRGLNPLDLLGVQFSIGAATFWGGRENLPCKYLERLLDKPVFAPLLGRSGLNAQILTSGVVTLGDTIESLEVPQVG